MNLISALGCNTTVLDEVDSFVFTFSLCVVVPCDIYLSAESLSELPVRSDCCMLVANDSLSSPRLWSNTIPFSFVSSTASFEPNERRVENRQKLCGAFFCVASCPRVRLTSSHLFVYLGLPHCSSLFVCSFIQYAYPSFPY